VTTSTRPDNLALTLAARAGRGPAMVFDPQGLAGQRGCLPVLRWSLTRGCEQAQVAVTRAEALVPSAGSAGVENANFWRAQALSVTRGLLHAAALDGRPAADLYRWSHSAGAAKEAVAVLGSHPGATPGWDRALDAIISAEQRTRDSIWAMVANTFAPLADPAALAAVSPEPSGEFDPLAFLAMRGSVYLLGTASGASASATLVAARIEDLVGAARKLAARSPGQPLDPPLALVLDEAANYPLPSLPVLMSEGGGPASPR
jgi:type IV secretion system protein VirD4